MSGFDTPVSRTKTSTLGTLPDPFPEWVQLFCSSYYCDIPWYFLGKGQIHGSAHGIVYRNVGLEPGNIRIIREHIDKFVKLSVGHTVFYR